MLKRRGLQACRTGDAGPSVWDSAMEALGSITEKGDRQIIEAE